MDAFPKSTDLIAEFNRERRGLLWRNAALSSACHFAHRPQDSDQRYVAASGLENEE